jgi:hypothetical protein
MQFKSFMEALKGKQHKIDKNKNGQIDAHDFKLLRKEEQEITEATVKTQKYSWGTMKTVHHGADFSIPLHPEHHQEIAKLKDEQEHNFKTEDGKSWTARRKGDEVHFQGANGGDSTKVKHADLKESEERMARADYKTGPSGRKSHKEIVFNDAESKDEKEMKEAKMSDADMAERERIVKGMKKNLSGFKARYGDRAKEVMYATATKQAMKEETVEEAAQKVDIPAYLRKQQGQTPLKLSDLKRKDTISDKENLAKLRNEENLDELSKGTLGSYIKKAKGSAIGSSQVMGMSSSMTGQKTQDKAEKTVQKRASGINKAVDRLTKEEVELDEAMINGREYASHGLMHPDHAARDIHKVTGQSIDFYAHGTGDKVEGKVTKNDGKAVHIKDTKGKTHQFKVQRGLPKQQNEEHVEEGYYQKPASAYRRKGDEVGGGSSKNDVPFDGPYTKTKPAKNSDGTPQAPMSRARELAKQAMKKQMKEDIDRLFEKDDSEYNYEGEMAVTQLKTIIRHAEAMQAKMQPDTNLPEWVQSKITLATDYIQTASDYLHSELEEQAPVAPVPDRKYIKGTPEHKAYKATKKPINGMPTGNMKESFDSDGNIINSKVSYKDFAMMLEYETKDGRYVHKGTYGGSYTDPEGADDADDKKPKQQPAEKRGRGRPAGAKSGARKITGTSKLFK